MSPSNYLRTNSVIINGGNPLSGQVSIQGSKNATLPILSAAILFKEEVILHNVPELSDIHVMLEILEYLGATYTFEQGTVHLNCENLQNRSVPDELSNKLRASSLILGPLLARFGYCELGMPGGCAIGNRPLDLHFKGLQALGSEIYLESGMIRAQTEGLKGEFTLDFPSVGATENLLSASVLSDGVVTIHNIAIEPEIMSMIDFLRKAGARIYKKDPATVVIEGVNELSSVEYYIPPDRIEAGTYLVAAFATKGNVTLLDVDPEDLHAPLQKLQEMGAHIEIGENSVSLSYNGEIRSTTIKTSTHPGFPTDLQSPFCVLMTQANAPSILVENIFNSRFRYIDELIKMNAMIRVEGNVAYIEPSKLSGCKINSFDLRGSAAMIIAGLVSEGVTRVTDLHYLYRGYEALIEKLQHLGADICYV